MSDEEKTDKLVSDRPERQSFRPTRELFRLGAKMISSNRRTVSILGFLVVLSGACASCATADALTSALTPVVKLVIPAVFQAAREYRSLDAGTCPERDAGAQE